MSAPLLTARDVPPRTVFALEQSGVHPLLARLFASRGVTDPAQLDDGLAHLLLPSALRGAAEAAHLLADAIERQRRICIVADYDCDGATACAVAMRGLAMLGAAPGTLHYVVPDRTVHGYGLTPAIVDLALKHEPALIVTVDNGIASFDGVAHARARGVDVLVTDHHLPALIDGAVRLPDATCIVNPNQPSCEFASKSIAGVGVMFYVLLATRAELRARGRFEIAAQPRLDALLDAFEAGEALETGHLGTILAARGMAVPVPEDYGGLRFGFLHPEVEAHQAAEDLAQAIGLLVERPALESALAEATARFERDLSEGAYAEQQRLLKRKLEFDSRLRQMASARAGASEAPAKPMAE